MGFFVPQQKREYLLSMSPLLPIVRDSPLAGPPKTLRFKNIEVNLKDPRRPVAEILGLWAVIDVTPNSTGYEQKMI